MEITIQSFEFPGQGCGQEELYYRVSKGESRRAAGECACGTLRETHGCVDCAEERLVLSDGMRATSDTYMNLFDLGFWSACTGARFFLASAVLCGCGAVRIRSLMPDGTDRILDEEHGSWEQPHKTEFRIRRAGSKTAEADSGMVYLEWEAAGGRTLTVSEIRYLAEAEPEDIREIHLSLIICTYRRERELKRNLEQLAVSRFFADGDERCGRISVRVVDNAGEDNTQENDGAGGDNCARRNDSTEKDGAGDECAGTENLAARAGRLRRCIKRYLNPNTGGSGGFLRGMQETRRDEKEYGITHVLLMDDDVEFRTESLYRLYALLRLIRPEYVKETVAGRMFRTDHRSVQFTASETWNGGLIRHEGGGLDMTVRENLFGMNRALGEYSGWWFACYPMEYVRENLPFPFFLHCDDVEYGLRKGGRPIVLNGIQVWHETADYRQSPLIAYYDMRNMAIANALIGTRPLARTLWRVWDRNLIASLRVRDWNRLAMQLYGIRDYIVWEKTGEWPDGRKKHLEIQTALKELASLPKGARVRRQFRSLFCYLRLRLSGRRTFEQPEA